MEILIAARVAPKALLVGESVKEEHAVTATMQMIKLAKLVTLQKTIGSRDVILMIATRTTILLAVQMILFHLKSLTAG